MSPGNISNIFFFIALSFFLFLGYLLFSPFFTIILTSIFIAVIVYPLHEKFLQKLKSPVLSSLLSTLLVLIFFIIPSLLITIVFINEVGVIYPIFIEKLSKFNNIESFILSIPVISFFYKKISIFLQNFNLNIDIQSFLKVSVSYLANFIIDKGKTIVINFSFIVFGISLIIITVFFLFKDGKSLYRWVYKLIPMPEKDKEYIVISSYNTIQGVFFGSFLTAVAQGILSFVGYYFAGVSFSLFWAILTFFAAFLPIGGASLVWVPIAIYLFFTKSFLTAFLFFLWGTFVISTVDNIIKPVVIGEKANIHPMVMVFSILGGLNLFGFIGVFIAPIIVVILYNLLNIYYERYGSYF